LDFRLTVSDLRKSFRTPEGAKLEVLRGVSFSAIAGEMLAITGASGAGKSTLLHALGGLEAADGGRIMLDAFDVTSARASELASYRSHEVGFVFQSHHLLPDLTALENVALPLLISRVTRRASFKRAEAAQQRVATARALIKRPRLVLADEPTGNLDEPTGDEIGQLLSAYCRQQHAIIIIATHNARLAGTCDRVLVLEDGRAIAGAGIGATES
jgi:ABC-type lipoprotein export system ATPase subunit